MNESRRRIDELVERIRASEPRLDEARMEARLLEAWRRRRHAVRRPARRPALVFVGAAASAGLAIALGWLLIRPGETPRLATGSDAPRRAPGEPGVAPVVERRRAHEGVEPSVVNEGAVLESAADEHVRVRLAAATLELGPASRARLVRATAAEIDVELSAGRIDVEFHPTLAGAGLSVRTDEATVRVVGTRFVVERDASGTRVAVLEGRVRVEQLNGGSSVLLAAGDEHRVTASGRSTEGDGSTERKPEVPAASSVPPPNGDNVPEQRARAHNQRADAHERAGRWRAAADAYRRAIRESPAGAEGQAARFALARLLERRLGDVQGARREYRRYLERFPQGPNAPQVREALCRLEGRCPEEPLP